jgi:hypothetical protein
VKKNDSNVVDIGSVGRAKLNDEVDELFKLPLADFTGARNALAKRLKQSGRANDANLVKTLTKPSVSAWTVNQLYWHYREEFDTLLAAGQRVRKAQVSGSASKLADMRAALDARREALIELAELASSLLRESGSNPSPETIRRITTTLEAISALVDGPTLGRLTQDVDPPGFESLASFMAGTGTTKATQPARKISQPAAIATSQRKATTTDQQQKANREAQQREELRQAKIAVAKITLQMAKKTLVDARSAAQTLEMQQKKASTEAKQTQKQLREAEERFKKASAAFEAATERADNVAEEAAAATKAVEHAKRAVDNAAKELESLIRESSGR